MPLSILSKLIESPEFHREVSGMILDEVIERPCVGQTAEGPAQGEIVDYEMIAPLVFGSPEAAGVRFTVPFESLGVAAGQCKTSSGEDYTFVRDGAIVGVIRVELGQDALTLSRIVDILDGTIIEIVIDDVDVDELESAGVPPETFAGEA